MKTIYEGIFPDKNVIQVFYNKSNMADFQYQPCITLDSAQRNREESKLMLIRDAERQKIIVPPLKLHDLDMEFLFGFWISCQCNCRQRLRWSRGSVLAFSTQVCGFKPGWSRRIFRAKKILRTPSFGGEVKPSVPCRRFAACKRSLNLRGSRNLGKITGHLAHNSTFRC